MASGHASCTRGTATGHANAKDLSRRRENRVSTGATQPAPPGVARNDRRIRDRPRAARPRGHRPRRCRDYRRGRVVRLVGSVPTARLKRHRRDGRALHRRTQGRYPAPHPAQCRRPIRLRGPWQSAKSAALPDARAEQKPKAPPSGESQLQRYPDGDSGEHRQPAEDTNRRGMSREGRSYPIVAPFAVRARGPGRLESASRRPAPVQ